MTIETTCVKSSETFLQSRFTVEEKYTYQIQSTFTRLVNNICCVVAR